MGFGLAMVVPPSVGVAKVGVDGMKSMVETAKVFLVGADGAISTVASVPVLILVSYLLEKT